MKCKTARNMINDAIGGPLAPKRAVELERHLASCAECRGLFLDFRAIVRDAGRLETPTPSDRIWQEILTKTNETRRRAVAVRGTIEGDKRGLFTRPGFSPVFRFAAAGILLLAVVTVGVIFSLKGSRSGAPAALTTRLDATLAKVEEAQHYYKLALKALDEAIAVQKEGLDPRIKQAFLGNREAVDASIAVCEEAVAGNPSDFEARNQLLSAYKEKLDLLNDLMTAQKASAKKAAGPIL